MLVKITNGNVDTYPYNVGQLRRDNPRTSFPKQVPDAVLAGYGVYPVTFAAQPDIDERTQKVEQDAQPTLVDGNWTVGWTVSSKTVEEIQDFDNSAAVSNRSERDRMLAKTDWIVIYHTEKGTNIPAEIELYRQALRDITDHENWPHLSSADWPTKP